MNRRRFLLLTALWLFAAPALAAQQREPVVVFVVRHAERAEDGTDDPPISAAGERRAHLLAGMLRDAELTHIHTTDYKRTRATAAPVSAETGLAPDLYGVDDLLGFAARVGATPGRHLVVGHSNSMPQLISALGGEPGDPIAQDEYDRLYVLSIGERGTGTVLIRYGALYRP